MSEKTESQSAYDKLTPQRKQLVDMVLENLENGTGLWTPGWRMSGAPESAITGKKYRGVNNFFLTLIAMARGYSDNRWATYNQIEERDWHFKTDEEGNGLGKGAGVTIEFYELRDRETKKPFDRHTLDGMTLEEKTEYERENVYPVRKYYRVFNGDIIDGIPAKEMETLDESGRNERADKLMEFWSDKEAKIIYSGSRAFYRPSTDEIHLPEREDFKSMPEFYATALHEMGHSTGHESRLNRDIQNSFGDENYAIEELRAELASMFMEQDLGISVDDSHIRNNSAYIKSWHDEIKDNPNALFMAIADADKISRYVAAKEQEASRKETEPYAVVTDENEYGDTVYKVYMCAAHGQTALAINYSFASREALMNEFEKMQEYPAWADKEFQEVGMDELEKMSAARAEKSEIKEVKSEEYIKPSEVAARSLKERKGVDMTGRGIESLTRMSDREVVERARKTKNGEKFSALYNGQPVLETEEKDERSLMARLAMFCNGDKEQLLRVFKSSGQFRDEKSKAFYEKMAEQSMQFISRLKSDMAKPRTTSGGGRMRSGANAKT